MISVTIFLEGLIMEDDAETAYKEYLESLTVEELEALNPESSVEKLRDLSTHESHKVRSNVANNESTPAELFGSFVTDEHYLVRIGLVFNPNVTEEALEILADDDNELVRKAVASKKS